MSVNRRGHEDKAERDTAHLELLTHLCVSVVRVPLENRGHFLGVFKSHLVAMCRAEVASR